MERFVRSFEGKEIRFAKIDGELLVEAHDVAEALRFTNPRNEVVMQNLQQHEKGKTKLIKWLDGTEIFIADIAFIVELMQKAEAAMTRKFNLWFIKVVAAEIAKGVHEETYSKTSEAPVKNKPANTFATTQIAKKFNMTAIELNKILHIQGVQFKVNDQWVLYEKHQDKGLTAIEAVYKTGTDKIANYHSYWTEKGVKFIENLLLDLGYAEQQKLNLDGTTEKGEQYETK